MDCLAVLYPFNSAEVDIRIDKEEYLIGRAKNASYDIKDVSISRCQCILLFHQGWTLCDKSSVGTWLNGERLKQNVKTNLKDGDRIRLGETDKYVYIFCLGGLKCPNSCQKRTRNSNTGLDAEMAQRRRLFDFNASLQRDGLEKSILEKQQDRFKLECQQKILRDNFNEQLLKLEERNRQLQSDLEKKDNCSESSLREERQQLENQFKSEKLQLESTHVKETSELAERIAAFEAAENDLRNQNKALLERLDEEKRLFELRLAEERKALEAKFAEQLAEQQRLAAEKSEVEEALRLRIQDLEKVAHQEEEQQQQRREDEAERLSKEKLEFEKRLEELQMALVEKEQQGKQREKELQERDLALRAQEEQRERERKEREEKMEAEFLMRKKELEDLEKSRLAELDRHKEEMAKELNNREAEMKRKAEEHEKELEAQRIKEQEKLRKELEEKEQKMRQELEWKLIKLQEDKVAIEMNIRGELDKKEGENAEILATLRSELEKVKTDLSTTSNTRTALEKQLEEASLAKEAASKNELQARKDVIENFGELVENELQCSICSELFVQATTLNCNHTFCQLCISNWLEKQKNCPICRAPLIQQSRSLVLDNFIDKAVESLSEDMKKRRKEIVEERRVLAHVAGLVSNPTKKRKTSNTNVAVTPAPLQVVNGNIMTQGGQIIVPVTSIPAGARVIHLPRAAIPAKTACSTNSRSAVQMLTVPSTSQMTVLPAAATTTVHTSQPPRPQPSQPRPQHSAPQSSSAPTRMTMTQPPPAVAGIRAAAARPAYAQRAATVPAAPVVPPYGHNSVRGHPYAGHAAQAQRVAYIPAAGHPPGTFTRAVGPQPVRAPSIQVNQAPRHIAPTAQRRSGPGVPNRHSRT